MKSAFLFIVMVVIVGCGKENPQIRNETINRCRGVVVEKWVASDQIAFGYCWFCVKLDNGETINGPIENSMFTAQPTYTTFSAALVGDTAIYDLRTYEQLSINEGLWKSRSGVLHTEFRHRVQ